MDDMVQLLSGIAEPGAVRYQRAPVAPTTFVPNLSVPGAMAQMGIPSVAAHPAMPRAYVNYGGVHTNRGAYSMGSGEPSGPDGGPLPGNGGMLRGVTYARRELRGFGDDPLSPQAVVDTTLPAPVVAPGLGANGLDAKSVAVGAGAALLGAFLWRNRKRLLRRR